MDSCMHAYATVQKLLCNGSYCELILSLARASCRLSFAARSPAGSMKSVVRRCLLKKSVQIHASSSRGRRCGVAQASSDHPRWCDLIQFLYGSHSRLATEATRNKNPFSPFFARVLSLTLISMPHPLAKYTPHLCDVRRVQHVTQ